MTGSKTALFVIAPDRFRDEELNHPRDVLVKGGVSVTIASTRAGTAAGMLGHKETVDETLESVAGRNFDAVVVVGGAGSPAHLWDNPRLHEILKRHHATGKVVAAICLSGVALARAGLLQGVKATVYKSGESVKAYRECGVAFTDQPVVVEGNIITANGPAAAREFGHAVLDSLWAG